MFSTICSIATSRLPIEKVLTPVRGFFIHAAVILLQISKYKAFHLHTSIALYIYVSLVNHRKKLDNNIGGCTLHSLITLRAIKATKESIAFVMSCVRIDTCGHGYKLYALCSWIPK